MEQVQKMQLELHSIYLEAMKHEATRKMVDDLEKVFGFNGPSISDRGNPSPTQALYRGATRDVINRIKNYSDPKFFEKYDNIKKAR